MDRLVLHLGQLESESDSVLKKELCSLCVPKPLPSGILLGELREEFDEKIEEQERKMKAQRLFLANVVSEGKIHYRRKTAID